MSWVKDANKLGKYEGTYYGFRVYMTKKPRHIQSTEVRHGVPVNRTELLPGHWIAINKDGYKIEYHYLDTLLFKCSWHTFGNSIIHE